LLNRLTIACLILTVIMGPMGLEALSELSGMTITAGHYEFQEGGGVIAAT